MGVPLKYLIISDDVTDAPFAFRLIGERAVFLFERMGTEVITPDDQASCIRLLWSIDPQCSMLISGDSECIREAMTLGFTTVRYGDGSDAPDIILGFEEIGPDDIYTIYNHANMLPVNICRTERLIIRELSVSDAEVLFGWKDCHYYEGSAYAPVRNPDEFAVLHRRYIRNQYGFYGFGLWGLYLRNAAEKDFDSGEAAGVKETETLIGEAGIVQIDEIGYAELAYAIRPQFRGLGFASEAAAAVKRAAEERFDAAGCFVRIAKDNMASQRVAEKAGIEIRLI